jgi:methyl-accepting chemotaxis protein
MDSNKGQNQSVETMAQNFEEIENCVHNINEVSENLEQVVFDLAKTNESIIASINNVSAVTEEVSARANETLSESEKDALVVEEITNVIIELNNKAKQFYK